MNDETSSEALAHGQSQKAAPFLPTSLEEMSELGWTCCDVILVTGDAYVDHPSFGAAMVGRLLERHGYRVGVISQPRWRSKSDLQRLGRPRLFFGVTSGNMDSMVCRYTSDGLRRSDDAYSPDGEGGKRPDRATIVYCQRAREAYKDVPIIIGGIEASLRRLAHYDYWSDKVRRSILLDSRADLLIYGNAERAIVEVARRLAAADAPSEICDVRGTAFVRAPLEDTNLPFSLEHVAERTAAADEAAGEPPFVRLPGYEQVRDNPDALADSTSFLYGESNPANARPVVQRHGDKDVVVMPPPLPLSQAELDRVFELPFSRAPHPIYEGSRIPAWEMIRFSVTISRGCFGGCSFCAITLHEGRVVQSRSETSVMREIDEIRGRTAGFTGVISDLGGPTANMYRLGCKDEQAMRSCRRPSCLYPKTCARLDTDHSSLIRLYRRARSHPGVKKVLIASGLRHDLALHSKEYIAELTAHHVGGLLKLAPEHTEPGPLSVMRKPGIEEFERFVELFEELSFRAGRKQHIVPYLMAAHPGTTDEDMLALALWLKRRGTRVDQVQSFLPAPATIATAVYCSGSAPRENSSRAGRKAVPVPKGRRQRRIQKAFIRYHDPKEWPLLREGLRKMGREDLIGEDPGSLVPREKARRSLGKKRKERRFRRGPA